MLFLCSSCFIFLFLCFFELLIFNEEVFLAFCFFLFIFCGYQFFNQTSEDFFSTRARSIEESIFSIFVIKHENIKGTFKNFIDTRCMKGLYCLAFCLQFFKTLLVKKIISSQRHSIINPIFLKIQEVSTSGNYQKQEMKKKFTNFCLYPIVFLFCKRPTLFVKQLKKSHILK